MKRSRKILIGMLAGIGVLGISVSLVYNYGKDKGTTYTLQSESIEGMMTELNSVLKEKVNLGPEMVLEDIELDLYKDQSELLMTGQLYHMDQEAKVRWNYFGSTASGMIFEERLSSEDRVVDRNGVTWEQFLDIIQAIQLDKIISYGGDHVGILYFDGTTIFSEEEKAETYQYDECSVSLNEDGSIRDLGYYLYQEGRCTPVYDMADMNGEYEQIDISFSNKMESESYRAVARLGILIPYKA